MGWTRLFSSVAMFFVMLTNVHCMCDVTRFNIYFPHNTYFEPVFFQVACYVASALCCFKAVCNICEGVIDAVTLVFNE